MNVETRPSAPTGDWAGLPKASVLRLTNVDRAALAVALDSSGPDAPAVVGCDVTPHDSPAHIVADVLDQLASVARELFPAWLPGGEHVEGGTGFDRRTVRGLARTLAATSAHYGPFVEALAEDALTGAATNVAFEPDTRARGLARVLDSTYQRSGVALLVSGRAHAGGSSGVGAAAAWLADHGGFGVWLFGTELAGVERFPAVTPRLPHFVAELRSAHVIEPPRPDYPAVLGRPHPASRAEQLLEAKLTRLGWARGRVWNQLHDTHPLVPPIRVDLMWPGERCAVEIDGPDHRGALKHADDRRRDNILALDGYAVLRFGNDDVDRVLATIERLLTTRRAQKGHQE